MDKSPFNFPTLTIVDDGASAPAVSKASNNGTEGGAESTDHSKSSSSVPARPG